MPGETIRQTADCSHIPQCAVYPAFGTPVKACRRFAGAFFDFSPFIFGSGAEVLH